HWFSQANVLSTTQRCGNTAKPFWPSACATDSSTIRYCSLTQAVHSTPRYVPSTHTLRSFLQVPRICLKRRRAPAWSEREAAVTTTISNNPRVSTNTWRLRPLTFFPLSNPRSAPPTSVVFTDCLYRRPAVGCLCRSSFSRTRERNVSWILTHTPWSFQALK